MNAELESYLKKVDKYLRPLPASERIDIVKEIKSSLLELEGASLSPEEILKRFGEPKELAKSYLGDLLSRGTGFSLHRLLTACAFYGLTGFSGIFVIPALGIIAPTFLICGVISPLAGLIKLVGSLLGFDVPFIMFQMGSVTLSPPLGFVCSLAFGGLLLLLGWGAWKLLLCYIKTVSRTKHSLSL